MTLSTHSIDLNVTLLNPNTKQAKSCLHKYNFTQKGSSIFTAYGKPSNRKVQAFNEIKKEMETVGGWGMRITGAGSDIFSCAYKVNCDDGKDYLIYHTPCNRFAICLD